jgi:hypothetical protein
MRASTRILSAWAAAMLVCGAGCGALDAGAEGQNDGGAMADGGHIQADAGATCELSVYPVEPEVGMTVAASVSPMGGAGPYTYDWSVLFAGTEPVATTTRNADGSAIDFAIAKAGSYDIAVVQTTGSGRECRAMKSLLVKNPTGKAEEVLLRFIPPAASGIPVQQRKLSITGGTPQGNLNFALERGITLDLPVDDGQGNQAPVFVRLVANAKGFETEAYLAAGAHVALTVLDDSYDVLVIPDETGTKRFAPTLGINQALSTLTAPTAQVTLDPGVVVSGSVSAAGGSAVAGARVILARGRLPSTIGVVDGAGVFSVRVQTGSGFGLSVAPPESSGLPDLELADGVSVTAAISDLAVEYAAAVVPVNDLAAEVRSHTGARLGEGARVTLRGQIENAGTVTVGGTVLPAPGVVRRVSTTDANGAVSFAALPAGEYDLVVEPLGHGLADDATTRALVSLPVTPSQPVPVTLFKKVTLSGTLQRPAGLGTSNIEGTTVKAILRVGGSAPPSLGIAPFTVADPTTGTFGVRVDPFDSTAHVEYALVADPPAASGMARAMRVETVAGLNDVDLSPLALPRGLLLAGTVKPEAGAPLAGVYVEAYRYRAAGLEDPVARAEAVTDAEGQFRLMFCDPDDME